MSQRESVKFHKDQTVVFCGTTSDPRDNGSRTVIIKVRGRMTWQKLDEPEYKIELPSGVRVVSESELEPVPMVLKTDDQSQSGTAATETALPISPIPAAASGAVHTTRLVTVPAPAAAKSADDRVWPRSSVLITTYDYPGTQRPSA